MIEWSDPLHPESAPFVLDDEAEDKEWDVFAGGLHSAVRSLNGVLLPSWRDVSVHVRYEVFFMSGCCACLFRDLCFRGRP